MNKVTWEKGVQNEKEFWTDWFKNKGGQWSKDYANRLDADLPFQEYLVEYLPKSPKCTVLDVGAGPLTLLGKVLPGYDLDIVAVDPLADEYEKLLKLYDISPIVRTQYCDAE